MGEIALKIPFVTMELALSLLGSICFEFLWELLKAEAQVPGTHKRQR